MPMRITQLCLRRRSLTTAQDTVFGSEQRTWATHYEDLSIQQQYGQSYIQNGKSMEFLFYHVFQAITKIHSVATTTDHQQNRVSPADTILYILS